MAGSQRHGGAARSTAALIDWSMPMSLRWLAETTRSAATEGPRRGEGSEVLPGQERDPGADRRSRSRSGRADGTRTGRAVRAPRARPSARRSPSWSWTAGWNTRRAAGTFVAQPKLMQVRQLTSFSQDLQEEGWRPGSVMLRITSNPRTTRSSAHLEVAPGNADPSGGAAADGRRRADRPRDRAPARAAAGPRRCNWRSRGSLYRTLREVFGIELAAVEDIVETALADPIEASLLGVDTGLPMLLVHRTGRDADGPHRRVDPVGVPRRPVPVRRPAPAERRSPGGGGLPLSVSNASSQRP